MTIGWRAFLCAGALGLGLVAVHGSARADVLAQIDGIEGDSQDAAFKNAVEVTSFSWGATMPTTTSGAGGGMGTGRVNLADLTITKRADRASAKLFLASASAMHIKRVVLVVRKPSGPGGAPQSPVYRITLDDVIITKFQNSASSAGTDVMESVSFNDNKILLEYGVQDPKGRTRWEKSGWDLQKNTKI
jgi:type VI secretion system secreted protein Hcp